MECYENGPEGMPPVKRMSDSTIDWVINGVDTNGMYLDEQGHRKLRNVCHAVAEEVLARMPEWPALASQAAPVVAVPAPDAASKHAERANWTYKQWWEHVGAWEDDKSQICFGTPMAVRAMLIQFGAMVAAKSAAPAQAVDALPWPEMLSVSDIEYAQNTPDDWDSDYKSMWQKRQLAGRNLAIMKRYAAQLRAALAAQPAAPVEPSAENVRKYRAQGRAEALDIILALCAETGLEDYTEWSANGDAGDHSGNWDERKLRELLHVEDDAYAAFDKAEAAYWEYLGHKDEADRAKTFAENMHSSGRIREVLEKAGEWDLMAQLCWPDAAPVANAEKVDDFENLHKKQVDEMGDMHKQAAQPHDEDAAIRLRAICDRLGIGSHVPQDNATLWGAAFAVLGQIRTVLDRQAAQSAGRLSGELVFDLASKYFLWDTTEGWRKATQGTINMTNLLAFTHATIAVQQQAQADGMALLRKLVTGAVGRATLQKLADGQGTETEDGKAWLAAQAAIAAQKGGA
ncbi:MAG: hypothetical protein K2X55_02220 [Burkholderiaceae bacterium]|nr:hypothetical protein [Burkholderiaceae bacterium]